MSYYSNPHGHQCPWYPYNELFGPTNIQWCEEKMCQWVTEPINTYTNASYLILAIAVYLIVYKKKNNELNLMPKLLFGIGLASSIYHASNNYLGQILDFLLIFLTLFWPLTLNLKKLGRLKQSQQYYFYSVITCGFMILMHIMYLTYLPFQTLVVIAGVILCISEYKCSKIPGSKDTYTFFIISIITISIGGLFSLLDVKRILCTPSNHLFQGHALWHVISAIGLAFLIIHMYKNTPSTTKKNLSADDNEDIQDYDEEEKTFSQNIVMAHDEDIEYYDEEVIEEEESTAEEVNDEVTTDALDEASPSDSLEPVDTDDDQLQLNFDTHTLDDPIIDSYSEPETDDSTETNEEDDTPEKEEK